MGYCFPLRKNLLDLPLCESELRESTADEIMRVKFIVFKLLRPPEETLLSFYGYLVCVI